MGRIRLYENNSDSESEKSNNEINSEIANVKAKILAKKKERRKGGIQVNISNKNIVTNEHDIGNEILNINNEDKDLENDKKSFKKATLNNGTKFKRSYTPADDMKRRMTEFIEKEYQNRYGCGSRPGLAQPLNLPSLPKRTDGVADRLNFLANRNSMDVEQQVSAGKLHEVTINKNDKKSNKNNSNSSNNAINSNTNINMKNSNINIGESNINNNSNGSNINNNSGNNVISNVITDRNSFAFSNADPIQNNSNQKNTTRESDKWVEEFLNSDKSNNALLKPVFTLQNFQSSNNVVKKDEAIERKHLEIERNMRARANKGNSRGRNVRRGGISKPKR